MIFADEDNLETPFDGVVAFCPHFSFEQVSRFKRGFFPCWKEAEFFSGPLKLEGNLTELVNILDFEVKYAEIMSVVSWMEVMLLYI